MEDNLNFKVNGRWPQFLKQTEYKLILVGNWITTSILTSLSLIWAWHSSAPACFSYCYEKICKKKTEIWLYDFPVLDYSKSHRIKLWIPEIWLNDLIFFRKLLFGSISWSFCTSQNPLIQMLKWHLRIF